MIVLGIETSCDETGIAIFDSEKGIIANTLHSQIKLHQQYGGVVPELASRDHVQRLIPLIEQALTQANISKHKLDAIAYTAGPGLIGALLVGTTFAKSFSYALKIPAIAVHHMEGHLLAPMLENNKPEFPFIALLVSGGHTMLVKVAKIGDYEILGTSIDDAAGEAFDKTAKLLGLAYPGGPAIAACAKTGTANRFTFPRPLCKQKNLQFSFSGLKTAVLHTFNKTNKTKQDKADIAYAFQEAVVDTLAIKCKLALEQHKVNNLVIAGGVGANLALRAKLQQLVDNINGKLFYPRIEFCTDNGAMIAYAGYQRLILQQQDRDLTIPAYARWDLP